MIATSTMRIVASSGTVYIPVIPMLVSRSRPAALLRGKLSGPVVSVVVLLPGVLGRTVTVPKRETSLLVHILLRAVMPRIADAV